MPEIGSAEWDDELAGIGVERAAVDRALKSAIGSMPIAKVDPGTLRFDADSATTAAALVLLHESAPEYATLMELRVAAWFKGSPELHAWIIRQYAAMLEHGRIAVKRSVLYALWVDPFEVEEEARLVYPQLFELCASDAARADLVASSGPVPWDAKAKSYEWAATKPKMHVHLAKGLSGSFFDVYGRVDAVQAARVFNRIEVDDEEMRLALTEATTSPLMLWVDHVVWTKEKPNAFYAAVVVTSRSPRWILGAELVDGDRVAGKLLTATATYDESKAHRRIEAETAPPLHARDPQVLVLELEGDAQAAETLPGKEVALWPPGLRDALGRILRPN